jgi:hypothetical protein
MIPVKILILKIGHIIKKFGSEQTDDIGMTEGTPDSRLLLQHFTSGMLEVPDFQCSDRPRSAFFEPCTPGI